MTGRRVAARLAVVTGLVGAALVGAAAMMVSPAYAHNSLKGSNPKDKAILDQAPADVVLTFLQRLSPQGTKVSLVDPAGQPAEAGAPRFDGPSVMIPLKVSNAGTYRASYEVASTDGHPIRGAITFTLTALAVPSPAAVPATSAAPVVVPSPSPPAEDVAAPASEGGVLWWPWALAGLAAAAVAGLLFGRRRRT